MAKIQLTEYGSSISDLITIQYQDTLGYWQLLTVINKDLLYSTGYTFTPPTGVLNYKVTDSNCNTVVALSCAPTTTTTSTTGVPTTTTTSTTGIPGPTTTTSTTSTSTSSTSSTSSTTTTAIPYNQCYGIIYNAFVMLDVRGIANTNAHVPNNAEWETLLTYLGGHGVAGGHLKEAGTTHWNSGNIADNSSGFTMLGGGERDAIGNYQSFKIATGVWSTELYSPPNNYCLASFNTTTFVGFPDGLGYNGGLYIRLIMNSGFTGGNYIGNNGQVYTTVQIGTQWWVAENLRETLYQNGDPIPEIQDNTAWGTLTTGALCVYNNNWTNACIPQPIVP